MNLLKYCEKQTWIWNKEPKQLKDLSDYQLNSIKNLLKDKNGMWYGKNVETWTNSVDLVLRKREKVDKAKKIAYSLERVFADIYKIQKQD